MLVMLIVCALIGSLAVIPSSADTLPENSASSPHVNFSDYNSSHNNSFIQFKEKNRINQTPMSIAVGGGYYASHPISYGSGIGGETWMKNTRTGMSMQHDVSYAQATNGEVEVTAGDDSSRQGDTEWSGTSTTQMKVNEVVTNGKVHIGVLQGSDASGQNIAKDGPNSLINAWKKPSLAMDEDYIGTYHIVKNLTPNVPYSRVQRYEGWLNCCTGGYFDVNPYDGRFISADWVFNCSCFNPYAIRI